ELPVAKVMIKILATGTQKCGVVRAGPLIGQLCKIKPSTEIILPAWSCSQFEVLNECRFIWRAEVGHIYLTYPANGCEDFRNRTLGTRIVYVGVRVLS